MGNFQLGGQKHRHEWRMFWQTIWSGVRWFGILPFFVSLIGYVSYLTKYWQWNEYKQWLQAYIHNWSSKFLESRNQLC